jgi:hypothetical protein
MEYGIADEINRRDESSSSNLSLDVVRLSKYGPWI